MGRVLAIDAGFAAMGAVIAENDTILWAGTCRTERMAKKHGVRVADDDAERCMDLTRFLLAVIAEWHPAGIVVELPTGGSQGARPNRTMGMATGVACAVVEASGVPVEWVTPQAVKKAAGGKRDAAKEVVAAGVLAALTWQCPLPKAKAETEHIYDAAGALLAARNGTLLRALAQVDKGAG